MWNRPFPILAVAVALCAVAAIASPAGAAADPGPVTTSRTTQVGGINVVPTPSGLGLGLGNPQEQTYPECSIGAGCAVRRWTRGVGPDGVADYTKPGVVTFKSQVGVFPTLRLANRYMRDLLAKQDAPEFACAGDPPVRLVKSGRFEVLKGSPGHASPDCLAGVVEVVVRDGKSLVDISSVITGDTAGAPGQFPAQFSVTKLVHKAKVALGKSWADVPHVVVP